MNATPIARSPLRLVSSTPVSPGIAASSRAAVAIASDQDRQIGVALLTSADLPGGRVYLCDTDAHCINVLDQDHHPLFSFGGCGSRLGQFDGPADIAVVSIDAIDPAASAGDPAMLVVADRGNHRIQLFELDGAPIGAFGGRPAGSSPSGWPARTGWPFFRLASVPPLAFPSRLRWRTPYLDVSCAGAMMVRIDLAAALLPDFDAWIDDAPLGVLRQAFQWFASDPDRTDIPASCLYEILERLQPAACRVAASSRRERA